MWKKILSLFFIFLLLFTLSACSSEEEIKDEEDASQAIEDVSEDVSGISESLNDINEGLS